jgi:hypothetical protein
MCFFGEGLFFFLPILVIGQQFLSLSKAGQGSRAGLAPTSCVGPPVLIGGNAVRVRVRVIPKAMGMHTDSDSGVRNQEFLCRPQIRIGSVPYGTNPLLRI